MKKTKNLLILSLLIFSACVSQVGEESGSLTLEPNGAKKKVPTEIKKFIQNLEPFFERLGEPEEGEWLTSFKEGGQTF